MKSGSPAKENSTGVPFFTVIILPSAVTVSDVTTLTFTSSSPSVISFVQDAKANVESNNIYNFEVFIYQ